MKEKYSRPAVVNAGTLESTGITPMAVAAVLVGGYMAGRVATKLMEARPVSKMPNITKFRSEENDI